MAELDVEEKARRLRVTEGEATLADRIGDAAVAVPGSGQPVRPELVLEALDLVHRCVPGQSWDLPLGVESATDPETDVCPEALKLVRAWIAEHAPLPYADARRVWEGEEDFVVAESLEQVVAWETSLYGDEFSYEDPAERWAEVPPGRLISIWVEFPDGRVYTTRSAAEWVLDGTETRTVPYLLASENV